MESDSILSSPPSSYLIIKQRRNTYQSSTKLEAIDRSSFAILYLQLLFLTFFFCEAPNIDRHEKEEEGQKGEGTTHKTTFRQVSETNFFRTKCEFFDLMYMKRLLVIQRQFLKYLFHEILLVPINALVSESACLTIIRMTL